MNQVTHHDFGLFETEALEVDFISLNIKRITSQQITRLTSYFQNLEFNSYQKQSDTKQSRQDINNNNTLKDNYSIVILQGVEFYLVDFMKMIDAKKNTYQRKQLLEFFDTLMGLPPYQEQFSDKEFRKLLFFPVVNAIQRTERGPWIIQLAVTELLMQDFYPFSFPPNFFSCPSNINLQVKLSIIRSFAQQSSSQKTYSIRSFLNRYKKRSHSIQAQVKKEILDQFYHLLKAKIIQPRFQVLVNGNNFISKDNIQLQDIQAAKVIYFYEIIYPI